jgi:uncharacterized membrane protein SpoIIM required for sporulation
MATWFAISFAIGHTTAHWVVATLKEEDSTQPKAGFESILHPEIKYRRSEIRDPRLLRLTLALFLRNAVGCAAVLYSGSLLIFIPPLFVFTKGWFCGAILAQGGYQMLLRRTIPHALIEVPVLLAISSIGMLLAIQFYREVRKNIKASLLGVLKEASFTYIVCMPLLLASAALEGYATRILWG